MTAPGHAIGIAAAVVAVALSPAGAARAEQGGDWRAARWGMSVEEAIAALPGDASRLDPPEKLNDGSVVAVKLRDEVVGATAFRVRLVFDAGGKLAAVSLRTDPKSYFGPEAFEAVREDLAGRLGDPGVSSSDDAFVDMRQVTWRTPRSRVDVKYIPGVVVVLYTPVVPAAQDAAAGAR